MLTLRSMAHTRGSRHIQSFRACPTATGCAMSAVEASRIAREELALANRQLRRDWLVDGWQRHLCQIRRGRAGQH